MSDEAVFLSGQNSKTVEAWDSLRTGCPSMEEKRSCFLDSCWLSRFRLCNFVLDRWFKRTGLRVCKKNKKDIYITMRICFSYSILSVFENKTYSFFLFLWKGLVAGWVVVCRPHFRCWWEGILLCEHRSTVRRTHITNYNFFCLGCYKMCH